MKLTRDEVIAELQSKLDNLSAEIEQERQTLLQRLANLENEKERRRAYYSDKLAAHLAMKAKQIPLIILCGYNWQDWSLISYHSTVARAMDEYEGYHDGIFAILADGQVVETNADDGMIDDLMKEASRWL